MRAKNVNPGRHLYSLDRSSGGRRMCQCFCSLSAENCAFVGYAHLCRAFPIKRRLVLRMAPKTMTNKKSARLVQGCFLIMRHFSTRHQFSASQEKLRHPAEKLSQTCAIHSQRTRAILTGHLTLSVFGGKINAQVPGNNQMISDRTNNGTFCYCFSPSFLLYN